MIPKKNKPKNHLTLRVSDADGELIPFEKNLIKIGYFLAVQDDSRGTAATTRIIETQITVEGRRETASIEFSSTKGLPSTADRDKYIALMIMAEEQRRRFGKISNPLRFTGYRMCKILGLVKSGTFYEDINSWGERMVGTTITSRRVVYFAHARKYANQTISAFESFTRVGKQTGHERSDLFEVSLSQWLLENLNSDYAFPLDFIPYKTLKRPIAKGIYPLLHYWFSANGGMVFEKKYEHLAAILGVRVYTQPSRIKTSIGGALDELISINYISRWEIQPMSLEEGFKICLWPGSAVITRLALGNGKAGGAGTPKVLYANSTATSSTDQEVFGEEEIRTLELLKRVGISVEKAKELTGKYSTRKIADVVEFIEYRKSKSNSIFNPAGMIISYLEQATPIPGDFVTSHMQLEHTQRKSEDDRMRQLQAQWETSYMTWKDKEVEREISERYPGKALEEKVRGVVVAHTQDPFYRRVTADIRTKMAYQVVCAEVRNQIDWPTLEEWCVDHSQTCLFERGEYLSY